MPETVYDVALDSNPEYNTSIIRFSYESLTTPLSTYDYNIYSNEKLQNKEKF
ncbi:MAG: hypothetical protein U0354_13075 [Candidatus Sericytochromatia bacterium]